MSQFASSSSTLVNDSTEAAIEPHANERLPIPQAALVIVSLSLTLWTGIGFALRWLFG